MIKEDEKFYSLSGNLPFGGPSTWYITNWDQRRTVAVTMDGEQDDETLAIECLSKIADDLPSSIYEVYLSQSGEIISSYSDAEKDNTSCAYFPSLDEACLPPGVQTIRRDELVEIDRLGPDVDLVFYPYPPCPTIPSKEVVFKYFFLWQYAQRSWDEMNLWMRLPRHPNIVPFDRVVVDELEGRVIGFTNLRIPGGTLESNQSRVFKLDYLKQLIQVVDDLNLSYGIVHQDIAPRNLLIDDSTDCLMLFDFNFAARIKGSSDEESVICVESRNDVKGVLFTIYEIITRDDSLRNVSYEEQDTNSIERPWEKHPEVKLDNPVAEYQRTLNEWERRRMENHFAADNAITWPKKPATPPKEIHMTDIHGNKSSQTVEDYFERRQDVLKRGDIVLNWERPSQKSLEPGTRVLSSGSVVKCEGFLE